jgi:hypothetical protein
MLVLFIYITRLASNEIFSPSNKINREVGRVKDLSAPRYNKRRKVLKTGGRKGHKPKKMITEHKAYSNSLLLTLPGH